MCSPGLCSTGTWELPSTLWKVLTRCSADGLRVQSWDREAQGALSVGEEKSFKYKRNSVGNSLVCLVIRTWCFHYWDQIPFLVGELRSSKLHGVAKKKKNKPKKSPKKPSKELPKQFPTEVGESARKRGRGLPSMT